MRFEQLQYARRMESRLETFLPILAALVAAGCGSPPSPPPMRPNEVMACQGLNDKLLSGLSTSPSRPAPDYLELREETEASPTGPDATILAKRGTPCATASDKPACETALQSVHSREGFAVRAQPTMAPIPIVTYLVTTTKDQVEVFRSMEDLRALLAPIDTPADVEMIAGCGRALKTPGGWGSRRRSASAAAATTPREAGSA